MKNLLIILFCLLSLNYFAQGADNCGGATVLPVNATCVADAITNNENGRPEAGIPSPGCGAGVNPGSDVWYQITGTGGNVDINLSGSNRDASLAIWSNCPATTLISCLPITAGNSGSIIFPTVAATTYYIQITRRSGGDNANMSGNICATNISSAAPPNDNPCSATAIPVNTSCVLTNTTNLNATNTAGVTAPGCANYSGGDVWFTVVIPASGSLNLETYANSLSDGGMAVYSGTCGALTLVSCDDDSGPGLMPALTISGTPGTTRFIRFWEYGNNANGTFGICAVAGVPPSGNQNCSTATLICADGNYSGNSDGFATQELNFSNQGCLSTEHQSSWYYFSPTSTGTFSMSINPSSGVDYDFAIWGPYNGLQCPVNTAPLRCSFASGFSTSFESPSGTSYSTGLALNGNGNGNTTGPSDGTGTDILDGWASPITIAAGDVGKTYIILIDNFTADNTAFNIDITSTCGLNCTPLPIELLSFTVESIDNENVINWVTASEINNDYFTVENSNDGYNWKILSKIDGGGTNTSGNMYEYIDGNYSRTVNYYRLKQTDFDGASEYFNIVAIDNTLRQKDILKIYNMMGQEVDLDYVGLKIIHYTDNTTEKRL
jgi:hypothetical protein